LFVGKYIVLYALIVVILHFYDLYALGLVTLSTIVDEQALATADNKGCRCAVTVDVLPVVTSRASKDAGQKFEDPVDSILLTLVPLAGSQRFLPELLIGCLEFVKIARDSLLVALDGSDTTDNRVDVKELSTTLAWKGNIAIGQIGILLATTFTIFPRDQTEKVRLSSVEIRVLKVPKFGFGITLQDALLEVGYLMEPIHVQLSDKGREIPVLKKTWKDFICEAFMLKDYKEC
jgi:hypothetical protein